MNLLNRIRLVAFFLLGLASAHAQVVISQNTAVASGDTNNGQSFKPSGFNQSGSYTTSSAYLTQFTFVVSDSGTAGTRPNNEAYLLIYSGSGFSGGAVTGGTLLDVSTNTQNWATLGSLSTATFTFSGSVALDTTTQYYAVFSTSPVSLMNPNHGVLINNESYGGGNLLHSGSELVGNDAKFTATFATAAIPEPSTYAALFGLGALGFAAWRRSRRATV